MRRIPISIRVHPQAYEALQERAEDAGLTVGHITRSLVEGAVLYGDEAATGGEREALHELLRIGYLFEAWLWDRWQEDSPKGWEKRALDLLHSARRFADDTLDGEPPDVTVTTPAGTRSRARSSSRKRRSGSSTGRRRSPRRGKD